MSTLYYYEEGYMTVLSAAAVVQLSLVFVLLALERLTRDKSETAKD